MTNLSDAKLQLTGVNAALTARSADLQTLGNIGVDPHPEVLLAVALTHATNSIGFLIDEIQSLRDRIDDLETRRRR